VFGKGKLKHSKSEDEKSMTNQDMNEENAASLSPTVFVTYLQVEGFEK
jgi:hypothetical protein